MILKTHTKERKKLSEINRPVSSSTPESEPIHSKKNIETYVNRSRKLYPNERRAREIQKLITFDSRLGSYLFSGIFL